MIRFAAKLLGVYGFLTFAAAIPAEATIIDFNVQAANRGGNLTGIPDSPLAIGVATFTGGELLSGEVGLNADTTGLYATQGLFGSGETNPLVITFAAPVQNFSIFVLNGDDARKYTVSDNLGDSITKSLASAGGLGAATFALPGLGLTSVDITSANANAWDFAVDNVSFRETSNTTPEPESVVLLGSGLALLAAARWRKTIAARLSSLNLYLVHLE